MDFSLTEEQSMLKFAARDFLTKQSPRSLVREMEDEGVYARDLWAQLSNLGWLGVGLPEEAGGAGGSAFEQMLIAEEMGRALAPIPYIASSVIAGGALAAIGSPEVRDWLAPIASGKRVATVALAEEESFWNPDTVVLSARASGDGYTLNGTKLFVLDGAFADDFVVVARQADGREGLVLGIVGQNTPGLTVTKMLTIAGDGQAVLTFKDVSLPKARVLATGKVARDAVVSAIERGQLALCGAMLGAADVAMQMSVEYAKDRVQFGRPIGGFQAIQHKLATMMKELESARALTYSIGWRYGEGHRDGAQVAMAKAWMNETSSHTHWEAHQIHAGVAYMMEFDLQLLSRRGKSWESVFGDTDSLRRAVGDRIAEAASSGLFQFAHA